MFSYFFIYDFEKMILTLGRLLGMKSKQLASCKAVVCQILQ